MREMMSLELAKQRREELLREVELSHRAKARQARRDRRGPAGPRLSTVHPALH